MFNKEFAKSKTAAKSITYDPIKLKDIVLNTVRTASDLVGSTLGPNGKVVLIERQENLPPYVTKDGISVFRSMAFSNPTAQAVLEAARDSSSKTNSEAGDGTTTATILAEALIRFGFEYLERHPKVSTQKVVRDLEKTFETLVDPFITQNAVKVTDSNSHEMLQKVAMIATNNDESMSNAVVEAFDLVGHNGQMTINEVAGNGGFAVEKIEGFPIARGFEDSCGRFIEEFINDRGNYRTVLDKPNFLLYNGKLTEIGPLIPILQDIANKSMDLENPDESVSPNLVVMAHSFSDSVLAFFAQNFKNPDMINMLPVRTPMTQQSNSQYHFLVDVSSYTGAEIFDPLTKPLDRAEISDLGTKQIDHFEFYRYRSLMIGQPNELLVITRSEELENQAKHAESIQDAEITKERAAILTGGIAKIKIFGSSEAELKEKNHRVEDAIMAIRGAIKSGVLPGCSKTLTTLAALIESDPTIPHHVKAIMPIAFRMPFKRILTNGGCTLDEVIDISQNVTGKEFFYTYDALNHTYGDAVELGVIDSAPAVLMAIKNSLSVAKMLMGLSGIVVFQRDYQLDVNEARNIQSEEEDMYLAEKMAEMERFSDEE